MRFLIAAISAFVLAICAPAQGINLKNASDRAQERWCQVMVPKALAAQMPEFGVVRPYNWLWCKSDVDAGNQARVWVRPAMEAGESVHVELSSFAGLDHGFTVPDFQFDWLLDAARDAIVELAVLQPGTPPITAPYSFSGVVEQSRFVQVWKFELTGYGFYSALYATIGRGQDVVDLQGYVAWRGDTRAMTSNAQLMLRHGEVHHLDLATSMGVEVAEDGSVIFRHEKPIFDGMAMPFYGALIPEPDGESIGTVDQLRRDNAMAARGGPIIALGDRGVWAGNAGPHGAFFPAGQSFGGPVNFDFAQVRDYFAARPIANLPNSGSTGDQGIWGRLNPVQAFAGGDPMWAQLLRYSGTDWFLRGFHQLGSNDRPLAFDLGDQRLSYAASPFLRAYSGQWGKPKDLPWGYSGHRYWLDDQHRGGLGGPSAYVINRDWIMSDCLDHLLAIDSRSVRLRTNVLEASRAAGRMLNEWAHWWCGANATQRMQLEMLADRMLSIVEARDTMRVSGPVKVGEAIDAGNSKSPFRNNPDRPLYWAPWQESFIVDGAIAWAAIGQAKKDDALRDRCLRLAVAIANSVVDQGLIQLPDGSFLVGTYVRWNSNGAPNPPEYYQLPRAGAQTDLQPREDTNLVYGGISIYWYSGAILTAAGAGNAKAIAAREQLVRGARNVSAWQWLIGGVR